MPTYGYRCPECGHEYDRFQKINDATRAPCPECGTPGDRLISGGAGLVFKGSGFYETDYKRAGSKRETGSESDSKGEKSEAGAADKKKKKDPGSSGTSSEAGPKGANS